MDHIRLASTWQKNCIYTLLCIRIMRVCIVCCIFIEKKNTKQLVLICTYQRLSLTVSVLMLQTVFRLPEAILWLPSSAVTPCVTTVFAQGEPSLKDAKA